MSHQYYNRRNNETLQIRTIHNNAFPIRRWYKMVKKGTKLSDEVRNKISNSLKGRFLGKDGSNWKGGPPRCIDCGKEISRNSKNRNGKRCKPCNGLNMITLGEGYRKNPTCIDCGVKLVSPRALRCQKHAKTGKLNTFYGKTHSEETKKKIGIQSSMATGENGYNWRGGVSFEPYPTGWTRKLKEHIRDRDDRKCQICYLPEIKEKHSIHHIDYDKNNLDNSNLIPLCRKCHTRTNGNREYYENYFKGRMKCRNLTQVH